jgi:DNA-binding winged helix-turn-helix (wHTH) protein/tetratricopeptide (TPR) repeat protein/TolB-like protein
VEAEDTQLGRSVSSRNSVRFGPYLLDRRTRDLRKHGLRIKLSGQPLEVLLFLLERPGELVTREELRQRLWTGDIYVDFERSLNSAIKKLRRALNDDPQQPHYIETYPRKGYRFIGVIEQEAVPVADPAATDEPENALLVTPSDQSAPLPSEDSQANNNNVAPVPGFAPWKWQMAIALTLIVAAFILFTESKRSRGVRTSGTGNSPQKNLRLRSSIAVLGFKNLSSHKDIDWLSTAISQMLSTELAGGDKTRIIPEEIVARAKQDLGLKEEKDSYARDTLRELRTRLGSDYVVTGSYMAVGDKTSGQVRMDLRLQEAISGDTLTSIAVSGKQSEIFDLVARAGREMRTKLGSTVPPEGDVDWRTVLPSDAEAARLYSEGLTRLRVSENLPATDLLTRALAIEPDFALGHAALADAWAALGYDSRALASAQRALSLSNGLPEDERMEIQGRYYELNHDWAGAVGVYRHLWQDFPDDIESGLKLATAEAAAGNIDEAMGVLSNLRSLPFVQGSDPRIDLTEASIAARSADYKRQQALAERAATKAESMGARLLLARAKLVQGWALDDQSQLKEAAQAYSTAQQIFEQANDRDGRATALNDLGIILQKQGDLTGARAKLEEARTDFRQIGDENGLGGSLTNLGEVYRAEGDLAKAEGLYREALEIFRKLGRKDNEYAAMNNLGGVLYQRGDFRSARKFFENLLEVRQAAGDKLGVALAKTNLADVLRLQGESDRAAGMCEQALTTLKEIGDRSTAAAVDYSLAKTMIVKNDFASARRILHEALATNEEIGAKGDAAVDRVMLARVAFLERHFEQFDASVDAAIDELRKENRGADEIEARALQAEALLARGRTVEAQKTLETAKSIRAADWLARFHMDTAVARLESAKGNSTTAKRALATALTGAQEATCVVCQVEVRAALSQIEGERDLSANRPH